MKRVLEVRLTSVLLVVGGFALGLAAGLHAFHGAFEADERLDGYAAKRGDPAALRAEHGDRFVVHGRVEEKRVDAERDSTGNRLLYVLDLSDGTATLGFEVRRSDYEHVKEDEWVRVPLVYDSSTGEFITAPVKPAVQPWQYAAAYALGATLLAAGTAWRIARSGMRVERDGDVVRVEVPPREP